MAFENTITEHDIDASTQRVVQGFRSDEEGPDLAVNGLSDSILARLLRLFRLA